MPRPTPAPRLVYRLPYIGEEWGCGVSEELVRGVRVLMRGRSGAVGGEVFGCVGRR